jgi:hypothetical protein
MVSTPPTPQPMHSTTAQPLPPSTTMPPTTALPAIPEAKTTELIDTTTSSGRLELVQFRVSPHLFAKILFIFIIEVRESENKIDKEHSFFDRS